ncbi:MAG: hypothetical protein U1E51_02840 [Candidatus Binatia bacterium]|nr:hypothetical protein [Candidatus Binatia bacterium]
MTATMTETTPQMPTRIENQPPALAAPLGKSALDLGLVSEDSGEFANILDSARFEHMWRVAQLFSRSDLVPQQYRGKAENCFIAVQMAVRLHVDPMMFMQATYVVHGRPGMEAKMAIALINSRGPFDGPIQWVFAGAGAQRQCTAFAIHRRTGQRCEATVSWAMVQAEGWNREKTSKWNTMPDLMYSYRSAMFLGRLYAPECLMGMPTIDEIDDVECRPRIVDSRSVNAGQSRTESLAERLRGNGDDQPAPGGEPALADEPPADAAQVQDDAAEAPQHEPSVAEGLVIQLAEVRGTTPAAETARLEKLFGATLAEFDAKQTQHIRAEIKSASK